MALRPVRAPLPHEPARSRTTHRQRATRRGPYPWHRDWIDTAVPALGGKTPRTAARSKASREKLDLLLRDMENRENHLPAAQRFDIARLREELGHDAAT